MKRENKKQAKRKGIKIIVAVLLLAVILAVTIMSLKGCDSISFIAKPSPTPVYLNDEGSSQDGEAAQTDREKILQELEEKQLVVTDKLSSNISFPNGEIETIGDWIVENPEHNTVIMQAEVYLDDTLIAKSTPIYPNQHITAVTLLSEVDSGEYDVTAYLNYYDIETKEYISKAGYMIHLTVN